MANARWKAEGRSKERRRGNKAGRKGADQMPPGEPGSDDDATRVESETVVVPPVQPATQNPFAKALAGLQLADDESGDQRAAS